MFKPSRNIVYHNLTATNTVQDLPFTQCPLNTRIEVLDATSIIRVSINGNPAVLSGTAGIVVKTGTPLELKSTYIDDIKYIRESTMSADIKFQIVGTY